MPLTTLNFAIIDDKSEEIRKIAKIIEQIPDTTVVRELRTEEQALVYLASTKNLPDFLIVDLKIGFDYKEGYRIADAVAQQYPTIKIILVSAYPDKNYLKNVMAKGTAKGFVNKEYLTGNLPKAITKIINGEEYWTDLPKGSYLENTKYIERESLKRFIAERRYLGKTKAYDDQEVDAYKVQCLFQLDLGLTVHQWLIFKLFAKGKSTEQITKEIGSSKDSINVQKGNIRKLLDIEDKTDVWFLVKALEIGIMEVRAFLEEEAKITVIK